MAKGSPPLTREPPLSSSYASFTMRITPAYAGTTRWCDPEFGWVEDHPRLRGNHWKRNWEIVSG